MNVNNFEFYVSNEQILDFGWEDFINNKVGRLRETYELSYEVKVGKYIVMIDLNDYCDIINHDCTCQFDGEFCRHQIAVLHKLRSKFDKLDIH